MARWFRPWNSTIYPEALGSWFLVGYNLGDGGRVVIGCAMQEVKGQGTDGWSLGDGWVRFPPLSSILVSSSKGQQAHRPQELLPEAILVSLWPTSSVLEASPPVPSLYQSPFSEFPQFPAQACPPCALFSGTQFKWVGPQ